MAVGRDWPESSPFLLSGLAPDSLPGLLRYAEPHLVQVWCRDDPSSLKPLPPRPAYAGASGAHTHLSGAEAGGVPGQFTPRNPSRFSPPAKATLGGDSALAMWYHLRVQVGSRSRSSQDLCLTLKVCEGQQQGWGAITLGLTSCLSSASSPNLHKPGQLLLPCSPPQGPPRCHGPPPHGGIFPLSFLGSHGDREAEEYEL